jgi:deoxyadenosine/deoxycytidine kinase
MIEHIVLEGCCAVGKSTLCDKLQECGDENTLIVQEKIMQHRMFNGLNVLSEFYLKNLTASFFEIYMLILTYLSLIDSLKICIEKGKTLLITERSFSSCMIFSENLLRIGRISSGDFCFLNTFKNMLESDLASFLTKNGVNYNQKIVFLKLEDKLVAERLLKRAREEELNEEMKYFLSLNNVYNELIEKKADLIINTDNEPNNVLCELQLFISEKFPNQKTA